MPTMHLARNPLYDNTNANVNQGYQPDEPLGGVQLVNNPLIDSYKPPEEVLEDLFKVETKPEESVDVMINLFYFIYSSLVFSFFCSFFCGNHN